MACRSSGRISRSSLKVRVKGQRSRSPGQKKRFKGASSDKESLNQRSGSKKQSRILEQEVPRASTTTRNQEVIIIHATPHMNGTATTWGVFKAYAFFSNIHIVPFGIRLFAVVSISSCADEKVTIVRRSDYI